jgi:hypothetical protein
MQEIALWHSPCYESGQETKTSAPQVGPSAKEHPMYLLFAPPVVAFFGIFAITLRNQFTEKTNL